MRALIALLATASIAGFGLTSAASAADAYTLDSKGKCHNAAGKYVKTSMCHAASQGAKKKQCRDAKGNFIKCDKAAAVTPATPAKPAPAAKPAAPAGAATPKKY